MKLIRTQWKVIPDSDNKLKTVFYDLYNDKLPGQHTTNQSLQKKLERFRNTMAVEFYNLILEVEKYPELTKGVWNQDRWEKHKNFVIDYAAKYLLWNQAGEKPYEIFGDQVDHNVYEFMGFMENDLQLGRFNTIADKVIAKEELKEEELQTINNWLCGRIIQRERNTSGFILLKEYTPFQNFGMIRALYEWVVLVAQEKIDVRRCRANNCDKLFIPAVRGKEQLFCSGACRVREYRRQKKVEIMV